MVFAIGVVGGGLGQLASAYGAPDGYVSGASQAYLALVGVALVTLSPRSSGWWAAIVGLVVSIGLDVLVSEAHFVKIGHAVPLVLGLVGGFALRRRIRALADG